ncbi:MAG TPA: hypothetical protein RMH99_32140 [Sandaracinaceae bacterium LLY-WYZ-13_1]|nr:hypothetical protein [Sandaracinaceae bacterium LLY-WYZ-13_1]
MDRKAWTTLGCAVLLGAMLGACDGDDGEMDAGGGGETDAGPIADLPPSEAYTENEADEIFEPATIDWGCLGARTQPEPGAEIEATFELRDFQDGFEVDGVEVWLFSDNTIADRCDGASCQSFTTDADGNATVTVPANGWYAYRVLPKMGPTRGETVFGVFQYNEPAPASEGGTLDGQSVSGSTIDLIPALLGINREPGRAIVAGQVRDCGGANVANAIVRIYDPDGAFVEPGELNADPHYHYFNGDAANNLPDQLAEHTAPDGLYVAPQIPAEDDRPYRMEAWATVDGELIRVSCETARIFSDAVTILNLEPMRADAPAACE